MFDSHPTEGKIKVKSSEPADAAALIAEALKRKFAHRYHRDSEQEEGEDFKLPVRDRKPQTDTPAVRLISSDCFSSEGCWGAGSRALTTISSISVRTAHVETNWKKEVDLNQYRLFQWREPLRRQAFCLMIPFIIYFCTYISYNTYVLFPKFDVFVV